MIFITIGLQYPFDRLIKAIDQIAPQLNDNTIIAQIAKYNYRPSNMEVLPFISPSEFRDYLKKTDLIVGHAGMGTILSALEFNKPIIVMPRLTKYGEMTTEHQLATAKKMGELNYVHTANNEEELQQKLLTIKQEGLKPLHKINKYASKQLLQSINAFIEP